MKQSYLTVSGTIFALALAYAAQGCSSSSDTTPPKSAAGTGNSSAGSTSTAGSAGTGNTTAGASGDTSTAGTGGSGTAGTGGSGTAGTGALPFCTTETKGAACTTEGQACNKTCGPQSVGTKSETCTAGVYVEGSCVFDCTNTNTNWACYAGLATAPMCETGTQASMPCTAAACAPCQGSYLDSSGASKVGGCVCAGTAGSEKWSCASSTAWPTCM
jgi:hypothetical protein